MRRFHLGARSRSRLLLVTIIAVALVLLVAVTVYGVTRPPGATAGTEDYTIKASVNLDCTGTPWFVGQQKGFFEGNGFKFRDAGQTATEQRPIALAIGQIDVLDVDPLTLVNLIRSGAKVKAVAQSGDAVNDGDTTKEYLHWIVLNDSRLRSFADLGNPAGPIKIGVSAVGTSADLQTGALLRQYGIPEDRVQYVILADQYQAQALQQGIIDVATLHSAFYACANARLEIRVLAVSSDAFGDAGGTTLLIAREDTISRHGDALGSFIKGYKEAERWCNANRAEAGNITAKELGICTGASHYYSESGQINVTQLQYWIDQMIAAGDLQQGEIKPQDLYTDLFSSYW